MKKEQVLGLLRHILTFAGGVVIAKGLVEESLYTELVGGLVALVGTVWSIVSKKSVV